eukprot:3833839-Ditylum_brightwellii.AAC.1
MLQPGQISLPENTPNPRMIAPIAFAMASGGAGAPNVNPGDHMKQRKQPTNHAYTTIKGNSINVDADEMSDSGSESNNTSVPSNYAFVSSKELDE